MSAVVQALIGSSVASGGDIVLVQSASGTTATGSAGLIVPFGAAVVTAAGTGQGTYTYTGQHNGRPYFNISGTDPEFSSISYNARWRLFDGAVLAYRTTVNSNLLPWETATWTDQGGGLPVPIINCSAPVTAGNSVIALVSLDDSGDGGFDQAPIQVGGGDTVLDLEVQEGGATATRVGIFSNHNVSSGITGIALDTAQAVRASMQILEVSGLADAVATDTDTASGNTATPGVAGLTGNGLAIIISAYANATSAYSSGPSGGFTRIGTGTGGASVYQESYYLIGAAGASTITLSGALDTASAGAVVGGV